jgi:hypothetical protein
MESTYSSETSVYTYGVTIQYITIWIIQAYKFDIWSFPDVFPFLIFDTMV